MEETTAKQEPKGERGSDIKEIGKQELLRRLFEGTGYDNRPLKRIGKEGDLIVSNSLLMLEGVDFDLVYTPLKHLGYKSALMAMGPLYANCYTPSQLIYKLGLSSRFSATDIVEFWTGVVAAAKEHHVENLSLDLKPSMTGLSVGVAVSGTQQMSVIESIPEAGKNALVCITGNLGAAYMGLHVLEREKVMFNKLTKEEAEKYIQPDLSKYKYILSQYLSPEINPDMVSQFKEAKLYPSAGYFLTDGLAAALKQLCADLNTGVKVYLEKIPIASQTMEMAKEICMDAVTAALNGGDDCKFLFVIPLSEHERFHKEFPNVDIIGHLCNAGAGALLVTPEGAEIPLRAQGYSE